MFEIMDQLGYEMPDRIVLPVGNAGNISAVHKALIELEEVGWIDRMPMLTGIQAEGAKPLVRAFASNERDFIAEEHPETVATAIRIGNPISGKKALKAIYDTGGHCTAVSDDEILAAQKLLGRKEGIGVEPASAASIAGARKLRSEGVIDRNETVVCICTGNALKDPDTIIASSEPVIKCSGNISEIRKILMS
jgi:threonine synthase